MTEDAEYERLAEWLDEFDPAQAVSFAVNVTREGEHYLADVPSLPGAHTYAGDMFELGTRVLKVVRLMTDLPDDAQVALTFNYSWRDEVQPTSVLITVEHYENLLETIARLGIDEPRVGGSRQSSPTPPRS